MMLDHFEDGAPQHNGWRGRAVYNKDAKRSTAYLTEEEMLFEHELSQPNYYDYYLEEMTRR